MFFFLIRIIEVNQKLASLQRPIIVKPTAGRPDHQTLPRRGIVVSHVFKLTILEEEIDTLPYFLCIISIS